MARGAKAMAGMLVGVLAGAWLSASAIQAQLTVTLVGNAGVVLSDGQVSLLLDLPYESGAFGYMRYDPDRLRPSGEVVSVITHHHRDHFAPELFLAHEAWRVIGPESVTGSVPRARVLSGDSIGIGAFSVVVLPTPHTDDHRSYRVRWRDRVLHFVGDTEDAASLRASPRVDVLFVTPWLSCAAEGTAGFLAAARRIGYHLDPAGRDRICGPVEVLEQGTVLGVSG